MKKVDIKTGAILEIPLEKEYGYGYIKIIFSRDIKSDTFNFPIIKVYNLYNKNKISANEINLNSFDNDELVLYPLLMFGFPLFRGKFKWEVKGYGNLTEEDKLIPDFLKIGTKKEFCLSTIKEETKSESGCLLIRDFNMEPIQIRNYELIKDIGQWFHFSPKAIRKLITMY